MFRQYLFTRFDVERDPWHHVRRLYWVDTIVSANEVPLRVPDRQVEAIRLAEQAGAYDATILPKGTRVRILEGPFAGFLAEVRRASPRRRGELLLEFLGHQARIRVDRMSSVKV